MRGCGDDGQDVPRARRVLLASGELMLETGGVGGRGNRNVWRVPDPRLHAGAAPMRAMRRVPPPSGSRPLVATTGRAATSGASAERLDAAATKSGQDRSISAEKCPVRAGVSDAKGGQDRTLFDGQPAENPAEKGAENPAENPAANAHAGGEPQNLRIPEDPPTPSALRTISRPS
jgi:hypothetical protein